MKSKLLVSAFIAVVMFSTQAETIDSGIAMQPFTHVANFSSPEDEPPVDEDDVKDWFGQCPVWPACGITAYLG